MQGVYTKMNLYSKISIVIPAYNEEEGIENTIEELLEEVGDKSEIIIVEDGSTDQTPDITRNLAQKYDNVTSLNFKDKLGKANAVRKGFDHANNEVLVFLDADNSANISSLEELVRPIFEGEAEVSIGSRYLKESNADRDTKRLIQSKLYNKTTSFLLKTGIKDHQCGFKAIKKKEYEEVNKDLDPADWMLDTEIIYYAKKNGYRIKEIPIEWTEDEDNSSLGREAVPEAIKTIYKLKMKSLLGDKFEIINKYAKFGVIGSLGALINTALLFVFTEIGGFHYMMSAVVSIEAAIISMFFLNNKFTFRPLKEGFKQILVGIGKSNVIRSAGIAVQLGMLYGLTEFVGVNYLISNIIGIIVGSLFTFYGEKNHNWT